MSKCFQIRTFNCILMSFLVSEINTLIFSFILIKLISFPYSLGKKPFNILNKFKTYVAYFLNNTISMYTFLSRVKQITSPGWMHETRAQTWCTGKA